MLDEIKINELDNKEFRLKNFREYSKLAKPVWKRVNFKVEEPENYSEFKNKEIINGVQEGLFIKETEDFSSLPEEMKEYTSSEKYGLNDFFNRQVFSFYNQCTYIKIDPKTKLSDVIYVNYNFNKENNFLIDHNIIDAGEFSEGTVIISYNSGDNSENYHNGLIKIIAGANSKIKVIKIQNMNLESYNFEGSKSEVYGNSELLFYSVEMGARMNAVSNRSYLKEDGAKIKVSPVYLADKDRKIDLEYSVIFDGKKTIGDIDGRGTVKDQARKVFRGNLYFNKGARKSEGSEGEFAILLNKEVRSDSIPGLFCEEDDVIGAHSASIGKVDEGKLFYLMSRGLSERKAKKLIVESSFKPVLENIENKEMKDSLLAELERRI